MGALWGVVLLGLPLVVGVFEADNYAIARGGVSPDIRKHSWMRFVKTVSNFFISVVTLQAPLPPFRASFFGKARAATVF